MTGSLLPAFLLTLGMAFLAGAVFGAGVVGRAWTRRTLWMAARIAEQSELLARRAEKRGEGE